jgi:uncharacterized membrane protein
MKKRKEGIRLTAIVIISLLVITTGTLFSLGSFMQGEIAGGILGGVIATTILVFAIIIFKRGNSAIRDGFPLHDERSRKVLEKASSKAFYVSLYMLLGIGFLSDTITFRDVSQATSVAVGIMAILFAVFWAYYSRREI